MKKIIFSLLLVSLLAIGLTLANATQQAIFQGPDPEATTTTVL